MRFQNLPIKRKLNVISMLTSGIALLLTCAAFISYEQVTFRDDVTADLAIIAEITGFNSASSLSFEDADSATQTLRGLAAHPHVVRGCVYDSSGKVFATYVRDDGGGAAWPDPSGDTSSLGDDSLELFHTIRSAEDVVGSIYLESDLRQMHDRRWRYINIAAGVFVFALFVTWLIASRLQRMIAEPIAELAAVASVVGAEKNYTVRALKRGDDEIGRLIDGFNDMLDQIQSRDAELNAAQRDLEKRVENRTRLLEEARREATREKERLQFIFDFVTVGISLHSIKDDVWLGHLMNDAHLRICGLKREDLNDPGAFQRITPPEDLARQRELEARLNRGEIDHFSMEKRYLKADGSTTWVVFSVQRKDYPDGRIERLCTVVDITDVKRAQEEAAVERARFKFIFDYLPVGISLQTSINGEWKSSLFNPAHLSICGLTPQNLGEPHIFQRISHPEDYAKQSPLREKLERGEIDQFSIEKRFIRFDGTVVWVVLTAQRQEYPNGRVEVLSTVVDITDVKRAQEETAIERARFKFIFEALPVGISLQTYQDGGWKEGFFNDAHHHICGLSADRMSDPDVFRKITHPDDWERQQPYMQRLARGETDHISLEKRYIMADGSIRWIVLTSQRKVYPGGRVDILSTVVDITDLKGAQDAIERERARLKFIFDFIPIGIALQSWQNGEWDGMIINDAHLRICGIARDQLDDPEVFRNATHPDDRGLQDPYRGKLVHGDLDEYSIEKRFLMPDGRVVWAAYSARRKKYDDGRVEVLCTVVDITDLKKAQEQNALERERLRFIFDNLPVGVSLQSIDAAGEHYSIFNEAHLSICGITEEQAREPGVFARITHSDDYQAQSPLRQQLDRGEIDRFSLEKRYITPAGRVVWVAFTAQRKNYPDGRGEILCTLVDITDLKLAKEEAVRERTRFKFILDSLPVGVAWMIQGRNETRIVNPSHARITGVPAEFCQDGDRYVEATHPDDRPLQEGWRRKMENGEIDQFSIEKRYRCSDGTWRWVLMTSRLLKNESVDETQEISTLVDLTERKEAEAEIEAIHRQLLDTSRQAGMAEVATGVLHNVGNVLNSVNVSATLVADVVRRSKVPNVGKLRDLIDLHRADLGRFITEDPKGKIIPDYLGTLADGLAKEQSAIVGELDSLRKNIDHIKEIVAMQQNYAKTSGVVETISVPDLIEDALRMNAGSLSRHDIELCREYLARPVITLEKNKALQILINLVRNAKYACDESGRTDKLLTIRTTADSKRVRIAVIDNGIGISKENLTRIFAHGFTTRKEGHGFGLHSGALAAKEMGGSLSVHSDGPGAGATFVLELPYSPESKS